MQYFFLQCSCYLFCPGRLQLHDRRGCGSTVADPPAGPANHQGWTHSEEGHRGGAGGMQ